VNCPYCQHDNPEGRKYCRACAKPLSAEAAAAPSQVVAPPVSTSAVTEESSMPSFAPTATFPPTNKFIIPIAIAAVAFGHISRGQIARQGGREKGTGLALAGLILGYAEMAFFALIVVLALGVFRNVKQEFDKADPRTRAALLDRLAHGDPNEVTPEKSARHTETAIDMLRDLRGKEADYFSAHQAMEYACQLSMLGLDPAGDSELNTLLRESDYDTKILRCGSVQGVRPGTLMAPPSYVIIAVPRSQGNAADAPAFCLDDKNGIERYGPLEWRDALPMIVRSRTDPCPLSGTHVD
jgi:hypothetical protein